jgi:hypothetical protein
LPRRRRLGDAFASPKKIEQLLEEFMNTLGPQLSQFINLEAARKKGYEPIVQLLQRASNFLRAGADINARGGKASRYPKTLLANVIKTMSDILFRESQGRISYRTFTDNNLRILGCPDDIKLLLEEGRITLFEALQLKRLSAENLAVTAAQASAARNEMIARYRRERWILHRLRYEIDLKLGKPPVIKQPPTAPPAATNNAPARREYTSAIKPDSIFSEQLSLMIELLQAIEPERLEGAELERLLNSVDDVLLQLQRIARKQNFTAAAHTPANKLGFIN